MIETIETLEERLQTLENLNSEDDDFIKTSNGLSHDISNGKIKMYDIITALGSLLVNNIAERRAHGTLILSSLLEILPTDYLNSDELHFLCQFFADRAKDNHKVIPPLLIGVLALTHMKNIRDESTRILLSALFDNIPCQQQQVKDRFKIYCILKEFTNKVPKGIEQMGLDYVMGLISAMDGERDPRNLKFLFVWLPTVLKSLKMGHLTEEMFEVISCYFPIDFRTPQTNTSDAISREELSETLKECLCCVPEFDEWCIPLLIEKLDSALPIAKLDSLKLLIRCSQNFNSIIFESYHSELLSALCKESIENNDVDIQKTALTAVTALCGVLNNNQSIIEDSVSNVVDKLLNQMYNSDKTLETIPHFLAAICRGSSIACSYIADKAILSLLSAFSTEKKEIEVLTALIELTVAKAEMCQIIDTNSIETFFRTTVHKYASIRAITFNGLEKVARFFNDSYRQRIYTLLANRISEPDEKLVRIAVLSCLESTYASCGNSLLEHIFDKRATRLQPKQLDLYFEGSCRLMTKCGKAQDFLLPELVEQCLNKNMVNSSIGLNRLEQLLQDNKNDKHLIFILHKEFNFVEQISNWAIHVQNNYELLEQAANVCSLIIGSLEVTEQNVLITHLLPKFLKLCQVECPPGQYIILLESLLIRIRPEIELPDKYKLLKLLLIEWTNFEFDLHFHINRLTASIINKSEEGEEILNLLSTLDDLLKQNILTDNKNIIKNVISTHVWITKALVLKGSNLSSHWIEELINLLNVHDETAKSLKLIMDEKCSFLNKDSHSNIRLLFRQRFFSEVLSKLQLDKPGHIIAAGELIGCASLTLLRLYANQILRPLLLCLQKCTDQNSLHGALSALLLLLQDHHASLQDHAEVILTSLLHLSSESSYMQVRVSALCCIQETCKAFPLHQLLPHKSKVIASLIPCLDDKKRLVRQQAVSARSAWFVIDAPE